MVLQFCRYAYFEAKRLLISVSCYTVVSYLQRTAASASNYLEGFVLFVLCLTPFQQYFSSRTSASHHTCVRCVPLPEQMRSLQANANFFTVTKVGRHICTSSYQTRSKCDPQRREPTTSRLEDRCFIHIAIQVGQNLRYTVWVSEWL